MCRPARSRLEIPVGMEAGSLHGRVHSPRKNGEGALPCRAAWLPPLLSACPACRQHRADGGMRIVAEADAGRRLAIPSAARIALSTRRSRSGFWSRRVAGSRVLGLGALFCHDGMRKLREEGRGKNSPDPIFFLRVLPGEGWFETGPVCDGRANDRLDALSY